MTTEKDIFSALGSVVNNGTQPIKAFFSDLLHDGAILARAKPGEEFVWFPDVEGCGTYLERCDESGNHSVIDPQITYYHIKVIDIRNNVPYGEVAKIDKRV